MSSTPCDLQWSHACIHSRGRSLGQLIRGTTATGAISLVSTLLLAVGSGCLQAQTASSPPLASLATVTMDTGDLALGRRDFRRYTSITECQEATRFTRDLLRASLAAQASLDTLRFMPARDTLPAGVAVVARRCMGGRFSVAQTAPGELQTFFKLALEAGEDSLAQAIVARRVALAPGDTGETGRWSVLLWALRGYLEAEPARVAAAEALEAQLDRSAPKLVQARAHYHLLAFGQLSLDHARIRQEAERLIALEQQMTVEELRGHTWRWNPEAGYDSTGNYDNSRTGRIEEEVWTTLFGVMYLDAPDSLPALAQRLQAVYRTPALQAYMRAYPEASEIPPPALLSGPTAAVLLRYLPAEVSSSHLRQKWVVVAGDVMPHVKARYWYATPPGDTVQPSPGHVSMVISQLQPYACLNSTDALVNGAEEGACHADQQIAAKVRRWLWQYGPAGLRVTVVMAVAADSVSILLRGPARPDSVAPVLAWYVQHVLRLPVTVAIDTVSIQYHVPLPDGRWYYGKAAMDKQYVEVDSLPLKPGEFRNSLLQGSSGNPGYGPVVEPFVSVTGRDGKLLYIQDGISENTDYLLDGLLAREFRAGRTSGPTSPQITK